MYIRAIEADGAPSLVMVHEFTVDGLTRYVATTGNDTGNDCTNIGSPCATLGHAVAQANAGDTINLDAGTYNEPGLVIVKALRIQGLGVIVQ